MRAFPWIGEIADAESGLKLRWPEVRNTEVRNTEVRNTEVRKLDWTR